MTGFAIWAALLVVGFGSIITVMTIRANESDELKHQAAVHATYSAETSADSSQPASVIVIKYKVPPHQLGQLHVSLNEQGAPYYQIASITHLTGTGERTVRFSSQSHAFDGVTVTLDNGHNYGGGGPWNQPVAFDVITSVPAIVR